MAAASTKRCEADLQISLFHLMNKADHKAATGVTDWMTQRDPAAIHVDDLRI